ncbi:hypothetical protein Pfo_019808 [Paulownia fortunei]|nr:hypothetical protein Pfo_019808 [Paulownia fortunei]
MYYVEYLVENEHEQTTINPDPPILTGSVVQRKKKKIQNTKIEKGKSWKTFLPVQLRVVYKNKVRGPPTEAVFTLASLSFSAALKTASPTLPFVFRWGLLAFILIVPVPGCTGGKSCTLGSLCFRNFISRSFFILGRLINFFTEILLLS